jgi:phosphoribosylaminoimidazolecarboxamide formyltransferase/IMP cyclohydrolase
VNLYPFKQTIAKQGVTIDEVIENIDIGGPAMIRSSAKNHRYVGTVVDPADYEMISAQVKKDGVLSPETRKRLAVKAFKHTADYDTAIAAYLSSIYEVKI